jgi:hypothetical protein
VSADMFWSPLPAKRPTSAQVASSHLQPKAWSQWVFMVNGGLRAEAERKDIQAEGGRAVSFEQ